MNYARRDHLTPFTIFLLFACPFGLACQNLLLRIMKKLRSATLSCYVNPIVGLACFIILSVLGRDTHLFMADIVRNHPKVFALMIF